MRLIGKCPTCGSDDSITHHTYTIQAVKCGHCATVWANYRTLVAHEAGYQRKLIPVRVEVSGPLVVVEEPEEYHLPFRRLVVEVLNTALALRFKLHYTMCVEGGLEGVYRGEYIALQNLNEKIGIMDETDCWDCPVHEQVLLWYADVLRILLGEQLYAGYVEAGLGTVLKLSPLDPLYQVKVERCLWKALVVKTGSVKFAELVFLRLSQAGLREISLFIAGIPNDAIGSP
jgi:hypothetical protein